MRFAPLIPVLAVAFLIGTPNSPLQARERDKPVAAPSPSTGVPGITEAQLSPEYWLARLQAPDRLLMDSAAIDAQNKRLVRLDPSMHDLPAIGDVLYRDQVVGWIEAISRRPQAARHDESGARVPEATFDELIAMLDLDAIPARQPTRHGQVVQRAALRSFPTTMRVFASPGDIDIDRFQESALFPGTPVVIAHRSHDGQWLFVVSPRYAAWIEARHVAEGTKQAVFAYTRQSPYRVVIGAKVHTVFTPEEPRVSELQLDMGVRVPLADLPADQHANGQHAYSSWAIELPVREADGSLAFAPALLPRTADTAADVLALTPANLIRQSFKFLGERYGWGHSYNGRDCSGFVSEVYASMGVEMPRNTGDQASSPAFKTIAFSDTDTVAARQAAVDTLQIGDLVYIPGHVMMVVGHVDGEPYVIHDINGGSTSGPDGELRPLHLNAVSVTPLLPLQFSATETYVDRMTHIVRMRAPATRH